MRILLDLTLLAAVAGLTHLSLYGWARAPVNRVELGRGQRLWLVVLIGVPLVLVVLLVIFRSRALEVRREELWSDVVGWIFAAEMAVVFGIMPRFRDDEKA